MLTGVVEVLACKACSDRLGVSEALEQLGVHVFYVGTALTDMLKEGWVTLTYSRRQVEMQGCRSCT